MKFDDGLVGVSIVRTERYVGSVWVLVDGVVDLTREKRLMIYNHIFGRQKIHMLNVNLKVFAKKHTLKRKVKFHAKKLMR